MMRRFSTVKQEHLFTLPKSNFSYHNCPSVPTETLLTRQEGLDLYKTMVMIRRIETASDQVFFTLLFIFKAL